ncbi:hypothetical protein DNK06_13255 [Pseudomonas daroniae]|uniref:Uncharacterized protein n=2 Tax=Phytopseudomonas TaxID=3236657 RepID=A0ABY1ZBK3_9GAMM|nr:MULTISPECIES: hypothetical protein [Pseudomonadaceae]TBU79371.1 hypothetical protein DNK06_13255 [Pseudomonas daroniae]TBU79455.1 hypothetical protein DNK31_19470 [Pseudomonas sp. FRB 228]TBU91471.1 hypothetical protein DNJ99_10775 [Pseudomonas daroniae]TBV09393.1 hypothetical protein DNK34_02330 [Pseudomonas dryadis]TBV09519.1 hypothetical protein DNK08_08865 [Stutzerimonas kirkiae]
MTIRCLICNSSVVLSKDAAKALARLIGTLGGFLNGIQQSATAQAVATPPKENHLERAFDLMIDGVSGAASNWADTQDFIRDVRKHQFMEYDCLCLRCGAKFDEQSDA